ncbi:hypothetical protein WMY93_034260, partial [Mugilogobius chulae]
KSSSTKNPATSAATSHSSASPLLTLSLSQKQSEKNPYKGNLLHQERENTSERERERTGER